MIHLASKIAGDGLVSSGVAYILSVRRLATLLVVLPDLVKIVFIELAHKTGKIAVLEMLGQDGLGELLALEIRILSC